MRHPTALALAIVVALPTLPGPAHAQGPVLETKATVFRFPVVVTQKKKFVSDLEQKDFVLTEDQVPQKITHFAKTAAPLHVVFMVDSSPSMAFKLGPVKKALVQFVRRLRPQDRAKIVRFSDTTETLQEFTSDREALLAAVQKVEAGGVTMLRNALYVAIREMGADTREEVTRRAVVVLSDGEDTGSYVSVDEVLDAARGVRDVVVYAISLDPPSGTQSEAGREARELLEGLARETGGDMFTPDLGDIDEIYDRISQELNVQYLLGFSPTRRSGDRWHRLVVTVPGRKGLQIRHRPGYRDEQTASR